MFSKTVKHLFSKVKYGLTTKETQTTKYQN